MLVRLVRLGADKRLPLLAAAVGAVLARYSATDHIPIGIIAMDGAVRRVELPADNGATVLALVCAARDGLAEAPPAQPCDGEHAAVPAVLVAEQSKDWVIPDLRQDATVILRGADAALAATYNPRLFEKDVVQRFLAHVLVFVEAALTDACVALAEMDYLGADELTAIETATCPPPVPYPADATLQGLFRAATRAAPDAPAVEFAERTLTYRELDAQSDRVAAGLIVAGVQRRACVGVSIRPSADQIIAPS